MPEQVTLTKEQIQQIFASLESSYHYDEEKRALNRRLKRNINAADRLMGETALMHAIMWSHESIELLIKAGAGVNAANRKGTTPLMYAVRYPQGYAVVPLLLDAGADVNAVDKSGQTALMYALVAPEFVHSLGGVPTEKVEIIKVLVDAGADLTATDKKGNTALAIAEKYNMCDDIIILLGGKARGIKRTVILS